jgi:hypothetical protein
LGAAGENESAPPIVAALSPADSETVDVGDAVAVEIAGRFLAASRNSSRVFGGWRPIP